MLYNFIIVDDNEMYSNLVEKIVTDKINEINFKCETYKFNDYNTEFWNLVYKKMNNKVYILDIETPSENGIFVAQRIRNIDFDSIIIFISGYEDNYFRLILKSDTSYFCTIAKPELMQTLPLKLDKLFKTELIRTIKIKCKNCTYGLLESDIYFIEYNDRKVYVESSLGRIETNYTLKEIYNMLSKNFVYSHKACIVNMKKVIDYSLASKEIRFEDNKQTNLISRKYIENLDNFD